MKGFAPSRPVTFQPKRALLALELDSERQPRTAEALEQNELRERKDRRRF